MFKDVGHSATSSEMFNAVNGKLMDNAERRKSGTNDVIVVTDGHDTRNCEARKCFHRCVTFPTTVMMFRVIND